MKHLCESGRPIATETELKKQLSNFMQIPKAKGNHCYLPLNCNTARAFQVSNSNTFIHTLVSWGYSGPTHIVYSDTVLCCAVL